MKNLLSGKKVAAIVTDGFEQVELTEPMHALQQAGAQVDIIALKPGKVKGWQHTKWGDEFDVTLTIDQARPHDYVGLLLPGGVMNPDKLRRNSDVLKFVVSFFEEGKPVAAICHGPWTLIDAGVVRNRRLTSYESIQSDLKNAGAHWTDEPVVVDGNLITSRKPSDIPQFNARMVDAFANAKAAAEKQPEHVHG